MPPKKPNNLQTRIRKLLEQMTAGVYERDHVLAMALLSAVAGESIFLLGLPGVGKSLVARRLKLAFRDARSFEYLMSRFSTPDEIFGPVSISKLKDCDTYERLTDGYLPTADIVFLDEIWKAGPSIQNALLTVLNEKIFRNGDHEMSLPLKGIIAASNELPARNEGLEALWDRFLLRMIVPPLESQEAFACMITGRTETSATIDSALTITTDEYTQWQSQIDATTVDADMIGMIARIRALLQKGVSTAQDTEPQPVYVSDRRWKKIVRLMRTAALLNGRKRVELPDGFLIGYAVWDEAEQTEPLLSEVDKIVVEYITEPFESEYSQLVKQGEECLTAMLGTHPQPTSKFRIIDNRYYNLVGYVEGDTLIPIDEYNAMKPFVPTRVARFNRAEGTIVTSHPDTTNWTSLIISKNNDSVQIGNTLYPLERCFESSLSKRHPQLVAQLSTTNASLDALAARIAQYARTELSAKESSPFIAKEQLKKLRKALSRLTLRIRKAKYPISGDE